MTDILHELSLSNPSRRESERARYIAPELLADHVLPTPTAASDIYALGTTFLSAGHSNSKPGRIGGLSGQESGVLMGTLEGMWARDPRRRMGAEAVEARMGILLGVYI